MRTRVAILIVLEVEAPEATTAQMHDALMAVVTNTAELWSNCGITDCVNTFPCKTHRVSVSASQDENVLRNLDEVGFEVFEDDDHYLTKTGE